MRWVLVVLSVSSCATLNGTKPDLDQLKPTLEGFHQKLRWKDFRGASDTIVPERRASFLRARSRTHDERDLFVTDFSLEDAFMAVDTPTAKAVSTISWYRLPSATEETATVTSTLVWREGHWMVESVDAGPFPDLLGPPPEATHGEPKTVKAPDEHPRSEMHAPQ